MGCDKEVNISIKAGNQNYPMHPLDTTMSYSDLGIPGDGCVGTVRNYGFFPPDDMLISIRISSNPSLHRPLVQISI
jgi:hypothetical protein